MSRIAFTLLRPHLIFHPAMNFPNEHQQKHEDFTFLITR